MLATTHALVGALCATQIANPAVAVATAVISHPLLDLFPHWDFNSRWAKRSKFRTFLISALDCSLGLSLGLLLFGTKENALYLLLVMIAAQWADFLEAPYHFGFNEATPFKQVKRMQHLWHTKMEWPWGMYPQLAILLTAIWIKLMPTLTAVQATLISR